VKIVFEDAALAVIEKPSGLLAVPGKISSDSVIARAHARWPAAEGTLMVHRLDMDTSGLMIVALTRAAQSVIARAFADGRVEKRYIALLDGEIAGDAGTIRLATRLDVDDRPRQVVDPIHGKMGETEWAVVARAPGVTRVEFRPRTGRTHQLRLHAAAALGAPILGDRLYGRPGSAPRLMLHAERLALAHPSDGHPLVFELAAPF